MYGRALGSGRSLGGVELRVGDAGAGGVEGVDGADEVRLPAALLAEDGDALHLVPHGGTGAGRSAAAGTERGEAGGNQELIGNQINVEIRN